MIVTVAVATVEVEVVEVEMKMVEVVRLVRDGSPPAPTLYRAVLVRPLHSAQTHLQWARALPPLALRGRQLL